MDFATFFPIVAMGAMTVVAALLAWTVKQVLALTTDVAALGVTVAAIKVENAACEADRASTGATLVEVQKATATLTERTYHHTKMLERIEAALPSAASSRSSRTRAAK